MEHALIYCSDESGARKYYDIETGQPTWEVGPEANAKELHTIACDGILVGDPNNTLPDPGKLAEAPVQTPHDPNGKPIGEPFRWWHVRPANVDHSFLQQGDVCLTVASFEALANNPGLERHGTVAVDAEGNSVVGWYPGIGSEPRFVATDASVPDGDIEAMPFDDGSGALVLTSASEWVFSDADGNAVHRYPMPVGQTRIINGLLVMTAADGATGTVRTIILIPR